MAEQSWSDTTSFIYAQNIQELMDAINEWENAYSITPTSFTNDPVANKPIRALDISEMQDALDELSILVDGTAFGNWTLAEGKITNIPIKEVQANTNYLQDGKCYLCHSCDSFSCTICNNVCNNQSCTCNNTCYNQSCGCNSTCYSQVCSVCHTSCYQYNKCNDTGESCTCNSACYLQTCSSCNSSCFSYVCNTCNNTCYQQSCTGCDGTCYNQSCSQCNSVLNEYPFS